MVRRLGGYDDGVRSEAATGIRVLIADDHQMMRDGLRSMLASEGGIDVVGEAEDGLAAVAMARALAPDIVIMDIGMPGLNGVEATRRIRADSSAVKVIALSMYSDSRYVVKMLEAGALGFVVKAAAYDELHRAIKTVSESRTYLSPDLAELVADLHGPASSSADSSKDGGLTPEEREIVQLLADGHSSRQVARRLHTSKAAVETHRRSIMEKLNMRSIAELTKYAIREGLTSLH